jgi:hypothetical protein
MGPLALLVPLCLGALELSGASACPSPEQVRQRAQALGLDDGPALRVRLEQTERDVQLVLLDEDGREKVRRPLPREGTCGERAAAAAVVLATWSAELPGQAPRLESLDDDELDPDLRDERGAARFARTELKDGGPSPLGFEVAASLVGSARKDRFSLGARFDAAVLPRTFPVGALLTFATSASTVSFDRIAFGLGAVHRLELDPAAVDLFAQGFWGFHEDPTVPSSPYRQRGAPGLGARLVLPFGLTLSAKALVWMGGAGALSSPDFEALVGLGFSFPPLKGSGR